MADAKKILTELFWDRSYENSMGHNPADGKMPVYDTGATGGGDVTFSFGDEVRIETGEGERPATCIMSEKGVQGRPDVVKFKLDDGSVLAIRRSTSK